MAKLTLTPQQQAVVENRGGSLLVSAAAGSAAGAGNAEAPAGPSLIEEAWTAVRGWIGI